MAHLITAMETVSTVVYRIFQSTENSPELGTYSTYGIEGSDIMGTCVSVKDVSTDKHTLECFVELLNDNDLHPMHLMDVIEDFILSH